MQKINKSSLRFSIIYNLAFLALTPIYPCCICIQLAFVSHDSSLHFSCSSLDSEDISYYILLEFTGFHDDQLIFQVKMKKAKEEEEEEAVWRANNQE